jgi:hypothetical protein
VYKSYNVETAFAPLIRYLTGTAGGEFDERKVSPATPN